MQRALASTVFTAKSTLSSASVFRHPQLHLTQRYSCSQLENRTKCVSLSIYRKSEIVPFKLTRSFCAPAEEKKVLETVKELEKGARRRSHVPNSALFWTTAAHLPLFAGTAAIVYYSGAPPATYAAMLQVTYGAIMLSFLGAVHWGTSIADYSRYHDIAPTSTSILYGLGLIPPFMAFASLLQPPNTGMIGLMFGYTAALLVDGYADRIGRVPLWWLKLRLPLTALTVGALGVSFLFMPEWKFVEVIGIQL